MMVQFRRNSGYRSFDDCYYSRFSPFPQVVFAGGQKWVRSSPCQGGKTVL